MKFLKSASMLAVSSELLSKMNIIKLPENTKYNLQDTLNVLLHAATSSTNSLESASNDLKSKNPDKKIPSADTISNYINTNTIEYILSAFREINSSILKMLNIYGTTQDIAIDFHDIPYYGDKNTPGVRGIKPKNGTSWGYSFCTLDIIGSTKLTLDIIDVNGLAKNYTILIESLLERIAEMDVQIGTLFIDREFFNSMVISPLHSLKVDYVIAAKSNKKIKRKLAVHTKTFGHTSTVMKYHFGKNGPEFNLVAKVNKNYDPNAKAENGNTEYHLFATNKNVTSVSELIELVPKEYRKRWNIETGYRVKNAFKIRTCSKSPIVRSLFFTLQCVLYNVLNMLKVGFDITAYQLKSAINNDIFQCIRHGYESLCIIPIGIILDTVTAYNEKRLEMLRSRLKKR